MKSTKIIALLVSILLLLMIIPSSMANSNKIENQEVLREATKTALLEKIPENMQAGMYNHPDGSLTVYVKETFSKNRSSISVRAEVPYEIVFVRFSYGDLLLAHSIIKPNMRKYNIEAMEIDIENNQINLELYSESPQLDAFLAENNLTDVVTKKYLDPNGSFKLTYTTVTSDMIELLAETEDINEVSATVGIMYPGDIIQVVATIGGSIQAGTMGPKYNSSKFYTAGHLLANGGSIYHIMGTKIGTIDSYVFGSQGDRGIISIDVTAASLPTTNRFRSSTNTYTVKTPVANDVGKEVELLGAFSASKGNTHTTGTISAVNVELDDLGLGYLVRATYKCVQGDSGGGIFTKGLPNNSICYGIQSIGYFIGNNTISEYSYFSFP